MNVLIHNRKKNDDSGISFPHLQCWNPLTRVATIAAQVSGRRVSCRVRLEDLQKKYQTVTAEPMQCVTSHRAEIESAITRLIENKSFEEDGSINIAFEDL